MTTRHRPAQGADYQPIFIVGSPRSGTTLTGRILGAHPQSATFFVPYFVWERDFKGRPDDRLTAADASPQNVRRIRREFTRFAHCQRADFVIDQSPRNSLRIDFVRTVFPEARFIHVIRDARDAAGSIREQWLRRRQAFNDRGFRPDLLLRTLWDHAHTQPLLRHKLAALLFELGGVRGPYSRRRWDGMTGWGPRFPGWRSVYSEAELLAFCAEQWRCCIDSAEHDLAAVPEAAKLTIHYEELLADPQTTIARLLDFAGLQDGPIFRTNLPAINKDNAYKWHHALQRQEARIVTRVTQPTLERWGYAANANE